MPMPQPFQKRLFPILPDIVAHFGTPFHIYDAGGIRENCATFLDHFGTFAGFREFFAVKALPNPHILSILKESGLGFDCSSIPELLLAREVGATPEEIMFTSNNTTEAEFNYALADGGSIINVDDISLLDKLPYVPELLSFRYNPGSRRAGNAIIGKPEASKFGIPHEQIHNAYEQARNLGVKRFGLHTMLISNALEASYIIETARMLLELAEWLGNDLGIQFEFINIGGGMGIPYYPDDKPLGLKIISQKIWQLFVAFEERNGYIPRLYTENGRSITGQYGVLVTKVINIKNSYRRYVGVDANMSALMRPGMYGAYHHIDVFGKDTDEQDVVDIVGSLCENNDKFAVQRSLPPIEVGDLLIIHDTGAHGHAMGFTYNGRLRPQELLLRSDGSVERIRRAETIDDYFATLQFEPRVLQAKSPI